TVAAGAWPALFEIEVLFRVLDLREGVSARNGYELFAFFALHALLLLVGEGYALVAHAVEPGYDFHSAEEQHFDGRTDQLAVLAQAPEFGADAGRGHREREILLVAVEFRFDG